jgi:hypothetical protein
MDSREHVAAYMHITINQDINGIIWCLRRDSNLGQIEPSIR